MSDFEQQHAIPQQISAYQFRLVGDMTLKQFFKLAAGALVSLIIYATNFPTIIKWPFILVSFLVGVVMAFFPLEGRSLEKWVYLFAKSVYSPTFFIWNKSKVVKTYFKPEDSTALPMLSLPPTQDQEIEEQSIMAPAGHVEESKKSLKKLEEKEKEFLTQVTSNLQVSPSPQPTTEEAKTVVSSETRDIEIPEVTKVQVEKTEDKKETEVYTNLEEKIESEVTPTKEEKVESSQKAQFSPEASPPNPPASPNIVVGQVLENSGKIIDGAILEIKDDLGRPARAIKTNKVGHFQIVTPLVNGKYKIITEKEGFEFDVVEFEAKGEIIPPIIIKGQSQT